MRLKFLVLLCLTLTALLLTDHAFAQTARPFSTGISEGGGYASGWLGVLLNWQAQFYHGLTAAVRETKTNTAAYLSLLTLSFAYGVLHAGGPGHGKAVVASYMLANEQALKRGLIISFFAALLQGLVAIALVGILAVLINATAQVMTHAAQWVELISFAGIAALGAYLIVMKGRAFFVVFRSGKVKLGRHHAHEHHAHHDHVHDHHHHDDHHHDHDHHDHDHCDHFHAPDPKTLGKGFSWKSAIMTVFAAGSRPCSGAILVLVFALAQGVFLVGVASALAMAFGVALTTCTLASLAVLAKHLALRLFGGAKENRTTLLITRGFEFAASLGVFTLGVLLALASWYGVG